MDRQLLERIAEDLRGTMKGLDDIIEKYDLNVDISDLEAQLLDAGCAGVELCIDCGWWWDSFELNGDGICPDCHPDEED